MRKTRTFLCSMQLVDGACDERPDASLDEVVVNITSAPLAGNGISQAEYYYNDDEEHLDFSCQREGVDRLGSINTASAQETVPDSRSKARVFMTSGHDLVPASESTSSPLVCSLFVFDCMEASVRVAMYNEDDRQFHALYQWTWKHIMSCVAKTQDGGGNHIIGQQSCVPVLVSYACRRVTLIR